MDLIIKLFDVLFPVFLIIGIGYWYGKKDPKFDTKFITTFAGNFGLPAIIFYSLTSTNISMELFLRFSYYITLYVLIFSIIGLIILKILNKDIYRLLPPLILPNSDFEVVESKHWHNIVYPWDLISGNRVAFIDNQLYRNGKIERNVTIKGEVSIGKGTIIRSGTYLVGPISIGDSCDIGPNSVIGPSVSLGDNVQIGSFSEILDSIVMKNCEIGSYCSLKGTVVGENSSVGSHVVAIPSSRDIMYFNQTFSVSDRGAMIGDNSKIGNRAILQGGSILMNEAAIGDGELYNADFQGDSI